MATDVTEDLESKNISENNQNLNDSNENSEPKNVSENNQDPNNKD
jgi:hypothetical protein